MSIFKRNSVLRTATANILDFFADHGEKVQVATYEVPNLLVAGHRAFITHKLEVNPLEICGSGCLIIGSLTVGYAKKFKNPDVALMFGGSWLAAGGVFLAAAGFASGFLVTFASLEMVRHASNRILEAEKTKTENPDYIQTDQSDIVQAQFMRKHYAQSFENLLHAWDKKSSKIPEFIEKRPLFFGQTVKFVSRFADLGIGIATHDWVKITCALSWEVGDFALPAGVEPQFNAALRRKAAMLREPSVPAP